MCSHVQTSDGRPLMPSPLPSPLTAFLFNPSDLSFPGPKPSPLPSPGRLPQFNPSHTLKITLPLHLAPFVPLQSYNLQQSINFTV
jgi:hypothetical protein